MYGKMWDNIDRHILVVWQSVGVLVGAFAALVLSEKGTLPIDYSATLVVLVSAWQIAHVFDASWWFNRNQLIVTNIERQFLTVEDSRHIHSYFLKHRKPKILEHYKIQVTFGSAVAAVVLIYHFVKKVYSTVPETTATVDLIIMSLPYIVFVLSAVGLCSFYKRQRCVYIKLQQTSPGKDLSEEATSE